MLRDILERAIASAPDMEAVHESPGAMPEPADQQPPQPDVVIVGARGSEPAEGVSALLNRWPGSQVLMLTAHGRKAVMYSSCHREPTWERYHLTSSSKRSDPVCARGAEPAWP